MPTLLTRWLGPGVYIWCLRPVHGGALALSASLYYSVTNMTDCGSLIIFFTQHNATYFSEKLERIFGAIFCARITPYFSYRTHKSKQQKK